MFLSTATHTFFSWNFARIMCVLKHDYDESDYYDYFWGNSQNRKLVETQKRNNEILSTLWIKLLALLLKLHGILQVNK